MPGAEIKIVGGSDHDRGAARRLQDREAQSRAYQKDPDKFRQLKRAEYRKNPEKFRLRKKLWRVNNPEKAKEKDRQYSAKRDRDHARQLERVRRYGLMPERFNELFATQNGKCAICARGLTARTHVDHCHQTGQVRGLLCSPCNTGLGMLGDDPARLRNAANYIERHSSELKHG